MLPELKKSVIRVASEQEDLWFHAAKHGDLLAVREIPAQPTWDRPVLISPEAFADRYTHWHQYPLALVAGNTNLPVSDFSVDEPATWMMVARRLEAQRDVERKVIPVTPLRRFYDWLRFETALDVHAAIALGFKQQPNVLAELVRKSVKRFQAFVPHDLYLDEPRPPLPQFTGQTLRSTNDVVAAIQQSPAPTLVKDSPGLSFRYVECKVDPRRSTRAVYETGEPASSSGVGGVDLLLRREDEGLPIVGEIKVGCDTNPFMALVQGLTYAAEFCVPAQFERLADTFPDSFSHLQNANEPCVDLLLLLAGSPQGEIHDQFMESTTAIARGIVEELGGRHIRTIACLEGTWSSSGQIALETTFSFEPT